MRPFRDPLLSLSHSSAVKRLVSLLPVSSTVVRSCVAGERADDAVAAARALQREGFAVTIDLLAEAPAAETQALAAVAAYRTLLDQLADAGLAAGCDVSVRLTSLGLRLPGGEALALAGAHKVCRTAARAGASVTLAVADHATTDATLRIVAALREEFPGTGVLLHAQLRRTEDDCRALAGPGSRVRLDKGTRDEPAELAFTDPAEVDRSFVRCLKVLLSGEGHPSVATDDPRLVEIAVALASRYGRAPSTYELQLAYGVRPAEHHRLDEAGEQVRVYLPYGPGWHGYVMRRLAEHPANLRLFLTSLVPGR
ncbi:proline dehydrogenase family protein [Nocardioides sp. R1-1]|uniref:proline dehydrogenase family protein n=1 Tax=Nocardioides sp. R1-1 TaxID=3383502 RepID=UPI0038CFC942